MTAKPSVALVSLGCPKNLVDSQAMLGLLEQAGHEIVEEPEQAEVIIVNTCAFIEPAQEEAIDALLDLAALKRGACRALICAGCLTQRHGRALLEDLPEVDAFVGVGAAPRIVEAVQAALAGQRAVFDGPLDWVYDGGGPRLHTGPAWLAYLKVADGCNHHCAFCTIPAIRGPYRSVTPGAVMRQLTSLAAADVREVCLVAQDTSGYGRDLAPRVGLAELLDELGRIRYDGWLRLLYLHPGSLDEAAIARMCGGPPLVPYFDIPLQHVSRPVLRRMGRAGDAESHLGLVERIRRHDPEAAIRTTFIVGFPGETERDFEALLEFVEAARLDRLSCFRFWPEPGTRAAALPGQVATDLADERLDELMRAQEEVSLAINRRFIGRRLTALIEEPVAGESLWLGRTYRDAPDVDGNIVVAPDPHGGPPQPGEFAEVQVTGAQVHDLTGSIVAG